MEKMGSSESKLQWIAIVFTAMGLLVSTYYNANILKAARIDNELSSYLKLNEHYNRLLFTLITNDSEIFKKNDNASLKTNKYIIYELIELLATAKSLEHHYQELTTDVSTIWNKRIAFLFSKPAIQHAWKSRKQYAEKIYEAEFIAFIDAILNDKKDSELALD